MGREIMLDHVKVICFSVGLLLVLSGLNSVSIAMHSTATAPPVSLRPR